MKLKLNKKKLKNLSKDSNILPADMTPQIGGGGDTDGGLTQRCAGGVTVVGPNLGGGGVGGGGTGGNTADGDARPVSWTCDDASGFGSCVNC